MVETEAVTKRLDELGLKEYYPNKISLDDAKSLHRNQLGETSDIPSFFLHNVFEPQYDGRCIFILGQQSSEVPDSELCDHFGEEWYFMEDSPAEECSEVYSCMDVTVLVFLCCNYDCKRELAYLMQNNFLSVPLVVPRVMADEKLILQTSVLRGISKDVGFDDKKIPIVSFMAFNGDAEATNKSRILNNLLSPEDTFKPFNDSDLEEQMIGEKRTDLFETGLIDAIISRPSPCRCVSSATTCSCTFAKDILFLNLYDLATKSKIQKKFISKVSSLVTLFVDTGELKGNNDVIEEIVELAKESKITLILLTREAKTDNFEECKEAVGELQKALQENEVDPQVAILYDRMTGKRDKVDLIRWNLITKINHILKPIECEMTLKDVCENIDISGMISDVEGQQTPEMINCD